MRWCRLIIRCKLRGSWLSVRYQRNFISQSRHDFTLSKFLWARLDEYPLFVRRYNTQKEKPQLTEYIHIIFFLCTPTKLDYFKWSAKVAQSTCNIYFLLMGFSGIFYVFCSPHCHSCVSIFLHHIFLSLSFLYCHDALKKNQEWILWNYISNKKMKSSRVSARLQHNNCNEFNRNILQMLFCMGQTHLNYRACTFFSLNELIYLKKKITSGWLRVFELFRH